MINLYKIKYSVEYYKEILFKRDLQVTFKFLKDFSDYSGLRRTGSLAPPCISIYSYIKNINIRINHIGIIKEKKDISSYNNIENGLRFVDKDDIRYESLERHGTGKWLYDRPVDNQVISNSVEDYNTWMASMECWIKKCDQMSSLDDFRRRTSSGSVEPLIKCVWGYDEYYEKIYFKIKDGHHRFLCYKNMGIKNIPINVLGKDYATIV